MNSSQLSTDIAGKTSRRAMVAATLGATLGVGSIRPELAAAAELVNTAKKSGKYLARHTDLSVLNTRAKIVVELEGKLKLKHVAAEFDAKETEAEVKAKSTQDYYEKIAFDDSELVGCARKYIEANSENWIEGKAAKQELRPECRETRVLKNNGAWQQYCESEKLDIRETHLLHSPINTALLEKLLPVEPAKPSSSWTFENDEVAELFNLEGVHKSTLTARIAKVESGVATIELEGDIDGTANSVPTKLNVRGNCRAKFGSSCVVVTWVGLAVKENREVSRTEPGFDVVARVRLIRAETDDRFSVTDEELRKLALKEDAGRWLVRFQSPVGRFNLLGDRNWSVYKDSREETVLRLIKNNSVVAQCNISQLTKLDEGTQLTIDGMQAEIKQSLGKQLQKLTSAEEKVTSSKLRLLRSVAIGSVEDVPIQWIYNHLSDDTGNRYAMIYTMSGNMTEDFDSSDRLMTASFQLLPSETVDKTNEREAVASTELETATK